MSQPLVGVIMGSRSDWDTMRHACDALDALGVPHEVQVVSAHRTPDRLFEYASEAEGRGLKVIIAGAGGAAHLPGMVASKTVLPVLGVPVQVTRATGSRLAVVDRADAGRSARGDLGHRGRGRNQRRAAGGPDARRRTIPKSGKRSARTRVRELEQSRRTPTPAGLLAATGGEVRDEPKDGLAAQSASMRVGILGGGQLARMLALEGIPLGHRFTFLEPSADPPASALGTVIKAPYDDPDGLARIAACADVVTYEFENVPAGSADLPGRAASGAPSSGPALASRPGPVGGKTNVQRTGHPDRPLPPPRHGSPTSNTALETTGLPAVIKTRRFGYDGKGQVVARSHAQGRGRAGRRSAPASSPKASSTSSGS